jgi:hypothetical protein
LHLVQVAKDTIEAALSRPSGNNSAGPDKRAPPPPPPPPPLPSRNPPPPTTTRVRLVWRWLAMVYWRRARAESVATLLHARTAVCCTLSVARCMACACVSSVRFAPCVRRACWTACCLSCALRGACRRLCVFRQEQGARGRAGGVSALRQVGRTARDCPAGARPGRRSAVQPCRAAVLYCIQAYAHMVLWGCVAVPYVCSACTLGPIFDDWRAMPASVRCCCKRSFRAHSARGRLPRQAIRLFAPMCSAGPFCCLPFDACNAPVVRTIRAKSETTSRRLTNS